MNTALSDITLALGKAGLPAPEAAAAPGGILFFSGGSALKDISRELAALTSDSTHVISTFDSGGSTAELRRAFNTPAIGDLRLRLSSLAGSDIFERRFGASGAAELDALITSGEGLPQDFTELLKYFRAVMPPDFKLDGAALGNLIMTADYLKNGRSLYETLQRFSAALGARGLILPVSEDSVHLGVRLESGQVLFGQHSFTGKNGASPASAINKMFFCRSLGDPVPLEPRAGRDVLEQIAQSRLICYPVGSFYSSVLANLQVSGVGRAIMGSQAAKLYMPNPGPDPESVGLSLQAQLLAICRAVSGSESPEGVLDYLLLDECYGTYLGGIPFEWCRNNGIKIINYNYINNKPGGPPLADPQKSALALAVLSGLGR